MMHRDGLVITSSYAAISHNQQAIKRTQAAGAEDDSCIELLLFYALCCPLLLIAVFSRV